MSTPIVSRRSKTHDDRPFVQHADSNLSDCSDSATTSSSIASRFRSRWQVWQRKIPCLKRVQETFLRVPPRVRMCFIIFWFCWKIILALAFLIIFLRGGYGGEEATARAIGATTPRGQSPMRILYVVTTLAEFNTGSRSTKQGQDRLGEVLIPVVVDSIESMLIPPFNYQVDLFLICGYTLEPEREQFIRDRLPHDVGLQVWDDAIPMGYNPRKNKEGIIFNTRALARQHRYVIKDKFFHYDFFAAFEDDIRITGHHVQHYVTVSAEIDRLREQAPTTLDDLPDKVDDYTHSKFFGQMTRQQLSRVVPGFIRVEVLLNETEHGAQKKALPIPLDYEFDDIGTRHVDPEICCHVHMTPNIGTPQRPPSEDLIMWETNAKAFSLRQLPPGSSLLDWVVLMMGPGKKLDPNEKIGGYWSGREGAFGDEKKPSGGAPDLVAQQGGWMATRDQIARMNNGLCMGNFLPPFDRESYNNDGLEPNNVEFWSGSYQFFTGVKNGCNMQRIISMHPKHFSKHLLYHVANNKQRQLDTERMVRADHLFAQLNAVQKMASKAKSTIEAKK